MLPIIDVLGGIFDKHIKNQNIFHQIRTGLKNYLVGFQPLCPNFPPVHIYYNQQQNQKSSKRHEAMLIFTKTNIIFTIIKKLTLR